MIGTITPTAMTVPPPSIVTTGLTSAASVTYDSAIATNLTVPTDTFFS